MMHDNLKSIGVTVLIELLKQLPKETVIVPNDIKNLAFFNNGKYNGFIDILTERIDWA